MSGLNLWTFAIYFLVCVVVGVVVGSRKQKTAEDYFLAGRSLPWYVVGCSYIGSNLSTEHFIGMIGMAYLYGIALAAWEWNGIVTFSILAWLILPLYYRKGFYTMPEFLERRFSAGCRYAFGILTVLINISAFLAAVLFAGGVALKALFGWELEVGIIVIAVVAGSYTIYGGLVSVAWTDFIQVIVMMASGVLVLVFGLEEVGGWSTLVEQAPEHFQLFLPADHEVFPWPGVFAVIVSVNVWYTSTNQNLIQRILGARSEWDARMGIVTAGFIKITTPFVIVVPGIIAFVLYPNLSDSNTAYPVLAREVLPAGLFGLLMAAFTAAIMSTVDSVVNSTSTIITLDFYKRLFKKGASDREIVFTGKVSSALVLLVATVGACLIDEASRVFILIQNLFAYIGPPAAAVFILGIFWKRANHIAALATLLGGIPVAVFIETFVFPDIVFLYRMFLTWVACLVMMVVISLLSRKPDPDRIRDVVWSSSYLSVPLRPGTEKFSVLTDFRVWWLIYATLTLSVYYWFFSY